jgi:predicted Co/Zn/Cd cation transporter (cation efflux family)
LISILLIRLITLVKITLGIFSNSLALISDAIHYLGDTLALILAMAANKGRAIHELPLSGIKAPVPEYLIQATFGCPFRQ